MFSGSLAYLIWQKTSGPREEVLFWLSGSFLRLLLFEQFAYFRISNFLTQIWSFKDYNLSIDTFHRLTRNSSMKPRSLFCLFWATYSLNFIIAIGFNGVKVHCAFLTKTENNRVKGVQLRSFFWSVFFLLWTEYGNLRRNLRRMQENADQKNSVIGQFLRNVRMKETASNQHKLFRGLFSDIFGM